MPAATDLLSYDEIRHEWANSAQPGDRDRLRRERYRKCNECTRIKPFDAFSRCGRARRICDECHPGWLIKLESPTEKLICRGVKGYGTTREHMEEIVQESHGRCMRRGCDSLDPPLISSLHIDHCHTTGLVRGLLCAGCNTSLGHLEDVEKIIGLHHYLDRAAEIQRKCGIAAS